MTTYELDEDTRITAESDTLFRCQMSDRWSIGPVPNGGYVMSIAFRALDALLPHPDMLTLSGHYLAPTRPGPTELVGERIRVGRSTSVGMVKLVQDGKERARFLATSGHLDEASGVEDIHVSGPPAEIPPIAQCIRLPHVAGHTPTITARFDAHHTPGSTQWLRGEGPGEMVSGGYIRFVDGRPPDLLALPLFADSFMPTLFNRLGRAGWVPTLQLNVQFRARPVDGYLRVFFRTRHLTRGLHEEDGELWDEGGNLVALSRQLARIRVKPGVKPDQ